MTPLPSANSPNFPHDELPHVDIRAVPFHRWRTLKWLVSYAEPGSACVREARACTFDDALHLAKTWSLAYWSNHYGISEILTDTPPIQMDPVDLTEKTSTIR